MLGLRAETAGDREGGDCAQQCPPSARQSVESARVDRGSQRCPEAIAKLVAELRATARLEIDEAVLKDDAAWQQSAGDAAPLRQRWR